MRGSRLFALCRMLVGVLAVCAVAAQAEPLQSAYSELQLLKVVIGKTEAEVKQALGEPHDTTADDNRHYWIYREIVEERVSRRRFAITQLLFVDGRVQGAVNSNRPPPPPP